MSHIASLHSLFDKLVERTREWTKRISRTNSPERKDDADTFYDIFMFGPHG